MALYLEWNHETDLWTFYLISSFILLFFAVIAFAAQVSADMLFDSIIVFALGVNHREGRGFVLIRVVLLSEISEHWWVN